jgi:hypothetical protein
MTRKGNRTGFPILIATSPVGRDQQHRKISGSGLWAIAAMATTPSLMGIGIAFFMTKQDRRD